MSNYKNKKLLRQEEVKIVDTCAQLISREELAASKLIDYLTTPVIGLQPEAPAASHHFLPSSQANDLSPKQVLECINSQFPKKWLKQIEIEWR